MTKSIVIGYDVPVDSVSPSVPDIALSSTLTLKLCEPVNDPIPFQSSPGLSIKALPINPVEYLASVQCASV